MYFVNKIKVNKSNIYGKNNFKSMHIGIVKSIRDADGYGRIDVEILGTPSIGGDKGKSEYVPAMPLLPKHLSVIPKVGESVLIFIFNKETHSTRFYIGPIISGLNNLEYDEGEISAQRIFPWSQGKKDRPVTSVKTNDNVIPALTGIFPEPEDISIQGRYNTDITQKRNEVVIRAGKFKSTSPDKNNPYPFSFNFASQGFIQIKNNFNFSTDKNKQALGTVTNVVSNKINLLTYGGTPNITLNQESLLNDDQIKNLMGASSDSQQNKELQAHALPFGDVLLEYLNILKDAITNHVHRSHGQKGEDLSSDGDKGVMRVLESKLKEIESRMLSKNIRIN